MSMLKENDAKGSIPIDLSNVAAFLLKLNFIPIMLSKKGYFIFYKINDSIHNF